MGTTSSSSSSSSSSFYAPAEPDLVDALPALSPRRWAPFFSVASGRLVGAECIVERSSAGGEPQPAAALSPARLALAEAMRLADDFLRAGCPLPLSVFLDEDDLDDPGLMQTLELWSMEHGGAHRLLGIELDVGAWDRRRLLVSRRIAGFGYEVTLGGSMFVDPTVSRYSAKRFSISASAVRLADIDEDLAVAVRALVDDVRAYGLEPVFKGILDPERAACLRGPRPEGLWQPDPTRVTFDADCLWALAQDLLERPAMPIPPGPGFKDSAEENLTWVTVEDEDGV